MIRLQNKNLKNRSDMNSVSELYHGKVSEDREKLVSLWGTVFHELTEPFMSDY